MKPKILVFGALGRVGTAMINSLPNDTPVRAADIASNAEFPEHIEYVPFDFNNPREDLAYLFSDVESMFLLWPPGVDANKAIHPVIQAAVEYGVKQVLFLSILSADKLRVVPHRKIEKMIESSGLTWVFLRSAYFMQNLTGIHAPDIRDRKEIFIPAGHGTLGLVDVRDVGAVGAKAFLEGHKNQAYNLTGGEALSFTQVAETFSKVLDKPISYSNPSIAKFFLAMRKRGIPAGLITFMIIEYTATKLGRSGLITEDVEKLLGRPPITLAQFVSDHAEIW